MLNIFQKDKVELNKSSNSDFHSDIQDTQPRVISASTKLFYPKPKILLIDLKDNSEKVLKIAGYKIEVGTFGTPYKTEKSENYEIIPFNFSLPNYSEQEIIVIDLLSSETLEKNPLESPQKVYGNSYYWGKKNHGVIDPRPTVMKATNSTFDRILKHSGVFIIFAESRIIYETVYGESTHTINIKVKDIDNWSFLSCFNKNKFDVSYESGKEISIKNKEQSYYNFFA